MIEPTMAVSQVLTSKKLSSGCAPKIAVARNPPSSAPTTPMMVVTMKPPGSSPGRIALAIAPAIRPSRIQPMMPMISPSFGPSAVAVSAVSYRLCFRSVPRVVWTPTGRSKPLATTRMKTSGIPHQTWVWDEGSSKPRDYVALEAETLHPREQGRPGTPGAGTGRREAGMRTPFTGRWRRLSGAPVAASVAVALAIGFVGCTDDRPGPIGVAPPPQTAGAPAPASESGATQARGAFDRIPDIVRRVQPSVVTIITGQGLGSGVVWSREGIIVTDQHVIEGSSRVQVAFADGRRVAGTVKAADQVTDLAIVQAQRSGLPPATFQPKLPQVGELAIAIGSPLGFENTVTAGIISGLHREIPGSGQQTQSLVDLIQTDAPISPGNSGGAVVNAAGQVIGISEAFIPPSQGAVSIGFAIPADTAVSVVGQLLQSGRARHAFLGVQPGDLTPETAQQLGVSASSGVVVLDVVGGGPAAKAGLEPGDVITAINGKQVSSVEDFLAALRPLSPGDTVTVSYLRGQAEQEAKVVLANRPTANG